MIYETIRAICCVEKVHPSRIFVMDKNSPVVRARCRLVHSLATQGWSISRISRFIKKDRTVVRHCLRTFQADGKRS